jgi:putative transposase
MNESFDFEQFKAQAIQGLYQGKPLTGEKGVFARQRPTVTA